MEGIRNPRYIRNDAKVKRVIRRLGRNIDLYEVSLKILPLRQDTIVL